MGSSNDKINYNLRPSKSIERKMIIEVLKEICPPKKANDYRYIGLGSAFFVDFKMIHRLIGIEEMYSFESKISNVERCKFNKPFDCIEVIPDRSENGLVQLDWSNKNSIVWLDFEDELKEWMISNLETVAQNSKTGTTLIITLRRSFNKIIEKEFEELFGKFIQKNNITKNDLHEKNSSKLLREVFINCISNKLKNAFSAFDKKDRIKFHQIFDFVYEDGAAMYTFGGIFLKESDSDHFKDAKFQDFEFVKEKNYPFNISCPIITDKEFHLLNSKLPSADYESFKKEKDLEIIPPRHRENYFRTYRYYPNYFELFL